MLILSRTREIFGTRWNTFGLTAAKRGGIQCTTALEQCDTGKTWGAFPLVGPESSGQSSPPRGSTNAAGHYRIRLIAADESGRYSDLPRGTQETAFPPQSLFDRISTCGTLQNQLELPMLPDLSTPIRTVPAVIGSKESH